VFDFNGRFWQSAAGQNQLIVKVKKTFIAHPWLSLLAVLWLSLIIIVGGTELPALLTQYGGFLLLGIVGAVFANATGAGGGVVFVPFFQQLAFSPEAVIATSFAIQCCGMTAGAISWLQFYRHIKSQQPDWLLLPAVLSRCIPFGLAGLWLAQYGFDYLVPHLSFSAVSSQLHIGFGAFSILLALAIMASSKRLSSPQGRSQLTAADKNWLAVISFVGGIITAYLSVGIGELVAVYLIVRRFDVTLAIGAAVIISAVTVWGAVGYGALVSTAVNWYVVLFAGAGAVIGGRLARYVVLFFSPRQVKLFFALWVLLLGILSIV